MSTTDRLERQEGAENVCLDTELLRVVCGVPTVKAPRRCQLLLTLAKLEDVLDSPAHAATQALPPLMACAGACMPFTWQQSQTSHSQLSLERCIVEHWFVILVHQRLKLVTFAQGIQVWVSPAAAVTPGHRG